MGRRSSRPAAPRRRAPAAPRRPASTAAAPPARSAPAPAKQQPAASPPAPAAAPAAAGGGAGGFMSQVASTAAGVAIGRGIDRAIFGGGGGGSAPEGEYPQEVPAADATGYDSGSMYSAPGSAPEASACTRVMEAFRECMERSNFNAQECDFQWKALESCQSQQGFAAAPNL